MNFEKGLLDKLHSPNLSWKDYENSMMDDYPQVVATVTQHLNSTLDVSFINSFEETVVRAQFSIGLSTATQCIYTTCK